MESYDNKKEEDDTVESYFKGLFKEEKEDGIVLQDNVENGHIMLVREGRSDIVPDGYDSEVVGFNETN